MKRTLISQEDLLEWLNLQLAKHDECTDCRFTYVQKQEEDEGGCNWFADYSLKCSGVPGDICEPIANQLFTQAREKFNVKW